MLKDTKPHLPEELITPTITATKSAATEEKEPEPPEPFEYP